jgi:hypothetical protein
MSGEDSFNMELRKEVLRRALAVEEGISRLLLYVLNTSKEDRKAISKKSSVLAFNHKVNLLYDLETIKIEEYRALVLFSQFRNKFLHDIDCSSFTDAISIFEKINNQKSEGKKLLKFHPDEDKHKKEGSEEDYTISFYKIAEYLYRMMEEKINSHFAEKQEDFMFVLSLVDYHTEANKLIKKLAGLVNDDESASPEIKQKIAREINESLLIDNHDSIISKLDKGLLSRFIYKIPSDL